MSGLSPDTATAMYSASSRRVGGEQGEIITREYTMSDGTESMIRAIEEDAK